jgi:hypothetical protein
VLFFHLRKNWPELMVKAGEDTLPMNSARYAEANFRELQVKTQVSVGSKKPYKFVL